MSRVTLMVIACFVLSSAAFGDRAPTPEERAAIEAVLKEAGCTGGRIDVDDNGKEFEVEDVQCDDGKLYEFELDGNYVITEKKLDD